MAKTLADMAAEERAECVGMWCSIAGAGRLCVLLSTENGMANLGFSHDNEFTMLSPLKYKNVTPRFDLPRVWTPDGEPDFARALSEETYFYGVQVWMGGRWIMMLTSNYGTSLMYRGKWFESKDEAEECAAKWNHDTPTRIVRQRRSPVEVINE